MNVWQVAAGDGTRDYSDVFLKFGVMLVGPGNPGPYEQNREVYDDPNNACFRSFMRTFVEGLQIGDLVALKRPSGTQWEILAVGEVASECCYEPTFSDVDGWDLQHTRVVKWKRPVGGPRYIRGLTRGTLKAVHTDARAAIMKEWSEGEAIASLAIPEPPLLVSDDELIESLINDGLSGQTAEITANAITRIRRIARWYNAHESQIGEHEIRTFLIVPLLTALGWAEQKIKIEWKSADVTLFPCPYKDGVDPSILIESKRLFDGLRYASGQAERYAITFPICRKFVVSDGIRYKLFTRCDESWTFSAYLNLLSPKSAHPYESGVGGAIDFLRAMLPG